MASDRRLIFLLHMASRAAIARANTRLAEHLPVSLPQLATLSLIAHRRACTPTDVAAALGLNKSAVTTMLRRLERDGWILRAPNPDDGRGALLRVSAKGERAREASREPVRAVMAELAEGFSPEEMEVVLRFLNAIVDRFGAGGNREEDLT